MTATGDTAQTRTDATAPQAAKVWVLDDPRAGTSSQTIGIAERLGVPFRCIPLTWNWMAHIAGLVPSGSLIGLAAATRRALQTGGATIALPRTGLVTTPGPHPSGGLHDSPDLVISAARRSGAVALWMKSRYGCRIVHCMNPGIGGLLRRDQFDLLVVPGHDNLPPAPNQMQVLGAPHRISALHLHQARAAWRERLAHLPRPLVALMVGGPPRSTDMQPALAHALGRRVARLVSAAGGSVMASTSRRTGAEATEALSAGLSRVLHVLYRWGEPGDNPYTGFLANADAIVVTADSVSMISEACATDAPVFVAMPELADAAQRRFVASMIEAGQVRPLGDDLARWTRPPLDEAGRVASEIHRRFGLAGFAPD